MSGPRARKAGGAVVAAVGLLAGVTACGGSVAHVRDMCGDITSRTAALERYDPAQPVTALTFAIDHFEIVDLVLSKTRETPLPDDDASALRSAWLEPAVASLKPWQTRLQTLRTAVQHGTRADVDAALAPALALGTEGVDTARLRSLGYDTCASAFTAPRVASTEA